MPWAGSTWNFVTALGLEKLEWCLYQILEKFDDMLNHLPSVRQTDKQTGGRISYNNISLCIHFMLTRDNNVKIYSNTCGHLWVWVFSKLRTANWRAGKMRTVRELSRWLAVTSVITWHMVSRIRMMLVPPWLSKQRTSNGELIASKSYVRKFQKHVRKMRV